MSKLENGHAYSDSRHAARLIIRQALIKVIAELSPKIHRDLALEILVESAVGFRAWDQGSSSKTSLQVGRLARLIQRGGELVLTAVHNTT